MLRFDIIWRGKKIEIEGSLYDDGDGLNKTLAEKWFGARKQKEE